MGWLAEEESKKNLGELRLHIKIIRERNGGRKSISEKTN